MHKYRLRKLHIILVITGTAYSLLNFLFAAQYSYGSFTSHSLKKKNFAHNHEVLQVKASNGSRTKLEQGKLPKNAQGHSLFNHFNIDFDFAETDIELEEDLDGKLDLHELKDISHLSRTSQNLCVTQTINLATNKYISAVWRPPQY